MKKLYKSIALSAFCSLITTGVSSQCATSTLLSSATNIFTLIRNGNNPIAADKTLNTVLFIHRNNVAQFGGNSGHLRYDLSTNGGATWSTNIGPINPISSQIGRYPNAAIYNPTNNVTPANAYIAFFAPTLDMQTSSIWNGQLSGVQQLSGNGLTENYNQSGVVTGNIPHSLVKGAPGVYWTIEPTGGVGYILYKGVWNPNTNDIAWASTHTITPPYQSGMLTSDYNIGFDPTGQFGWVSFAGHVTGGPTNSALYPVFYKSTDGGATWTGPIQVDLTRMSCLTSNTVSGASASVNQEHDLVVDMYGMPHFFTTAGSASSYVFNYSAWHHMFDITLKNGLWLAYDVATVYGSTQTWGSGADIATQMQAPQASRTADGSRVFFSWTDNSTYNLGTSNHLPNLFAKALNVTNGTWSPVKDFTSCNNSITGKIIFPHAAPEVLEPSNNVYKLATVYAEPTATNNLLGAASFYYLDNTTFSASDFSVATPAATVNIQQGNPIVYCPNSTVVVNVTNGGQAFWSTGATTPSLTITSNSITTFSVYAQAACLAGSTTFSLINLSVTPVAVTPSVCPASPVTFSVSGNAKTYSWMPGNASGTLVTLNSASPQVTLTATGSNCTYSQTIGFTIHTPPVITISGNDTICEGETTTLTANGAANYLWSDGSTNPVLTVSPAQYTTYVVTGTAVTTCTNSSSVNIFIKTSPTIAAVMSSSAVCAGKSVTINAIGAQTYSWSTGSQANPLVYTPPSNTAISVTGVAANGCGRSATVQVAVNALPTISVTSNRSTICKGERLTLTGGGATNYTWTLPASTSNSILVTPSATTDYTLTGKDVNGCVNSTIYKLTVIPCLGIGQTNEALQMHVYPNPNHGIFHVTLPLASTLSIFNELGQLIRTVPPQTRHSATVEIRDLASGVYYLVIDENGSLPQKVIVH